MTVLSRSKKAASTASDPKEALVRAGVTPVGSVHFFPRGLGCARKESPMLVACWSVKGGSGTTVVSAALALSVAATGHDALLVDMGGDLPAALGIPEPEGPSLADWLAAGDGVGSDARARLEVDAGSNLALLPLG